MKASDLRLNNYLEFDGSVFKVSSIDSFSLNNKSIKPIPLTEEWLIKMGFEKWKGWLTKDAWAPGHPSQRFDLYWSEIDGFNCKSRYQGDQETGFKMIHIQHVHTLQNLYHSLTGSELTIKE